ncbi:MAG: DUF523 and DUF1722 domain-containing protein [Proteobacteria bacterium]|nr:DUF523 and DUF1722 domain-containing protein [Pseudomonadota bacterium]MDA1302481.1 DUF523 and DUF1722 domain-containing protein [Pseudomonadota bacterium]
MAKSEPSALESSHTIARPRIGISSCLIGHEVRFDGGHKHHAYVTQTLGQHFDFVPFCPEVAIGLGTPRPVIRLQADNNQSLAIHAVRSDSTEDFTLKLDDYGRRIAAGLESFAGYILKKDSPSCGMERVKVYTPHLDAPPMRRGAGIFAARLMAERPELPIEEEGRLMDPGLRDNFITRVFTLFRWHQAMAAGVTGAGLVLFHTRHKFLILAHHEATYRKLGRLVARAGSADLESRSGGNSSTLRQSCWAGRCGCRILYLTHGDDIGSSRTNGTTGRHTPIRSVEGPRVSHSITAA